MQRATLPATSHLSQRLLCPLGGAAVRLADVTQGQRHVLQGEITGRR